jgi:hypothetical protein
MRTCPGERASENKARIDTTVVIQSSDMHNNKRSSQVRTHRIMVVGSPCSDDMSRTFVHTPNKRLRTRFLYRRPTTSCASVGRDLHNPKASVWVTRDDAITESKDHKNVSHGKRRTCIDIPAGALAS